MIAYLGQGKLTRDLMTTFGGYDGVQFPNLQELIHHICEIGYEHHDGIHPSLVADAVNEASSNYLGWDVDAHKSTTIVGVHSGRLAVDTEINLLPLERCYLSKMPDLSEELLRVPHRPPILLGLSRRSPFSRR